MAGESAGEVARRHREKIERLQRSAENWQRGADGEAATAAVLDQLPAGWTVLHDVRWPGRPRANIDHVVIGPAGVFVVDSKNWSGEVTVRDGVLRQAGRPREHAVVGAAEAALAVARLTTAVTVHQVQPVLCLVRDEAVAGWARDVMVTSTVNLASMLTSRPLVLHPARVAAVVADLRRGLTPASAPAPAARPRGRGSHQQHTSWAAGRGDGRLVAAHPAAPRRPSGGKGGRSAARTVRRLLVGVVAAVALVLGAPLVPQVTEPLSRFVTNQLVGDPAADPATVPTPSSDEQKTKKQRRQQREERRQQRDQSTAP